ncbi:MAG: hypothetical protein V5A55_10420 [Halovenus sp.]
MGRLRLFYSSGDCPRDDFEGTDESLPSAFADSGREARERIKRRLYLYHDAKRGVIVCPFSAVDGVEQQLIAEYSATPGEESVTAFQRDLREATDAMDMDLQEPADGPGSIWWKLTETDPIDPVDRPTESKRASPHRFGVPDETTGVGLYRSLVGEYDRVLVSRGGAADSMPDADAVVVPYESAEVGVLIDDHGRSESHGSSPQFDVSAGAGTSGPGGTDGESQSLTERIRTALKRFL